MAVIEPRTVTTRAGAIIVRTAAAADAPSILDLTKSIAAERGFTVSRPEEVGEEMNERRTELEQYQAHEARLWIVAEPADRPGLIVGELDINGMPRARMRHRARLGLNVRDGWRGRGVGRAMINAALEWARTHPVIEKVELGVMAGNVRAAALYRSLGFHEEGRRRRAFRFEDGRYEDDILMAVQVKEGDQDAGPPSSDRKFCQDTNR